MPCASKAVPHSAMFFFLISISRASSAALLSSALAAVAVRFLPLNRAVCCRSALFADRFVTQQHCYHLSFSWHVLKFTGTRQRLMMIKCVCVCARSARNVNSGEHKRKKVLPEHGQRSVFEEESIDRATGIMVPTIKVSQSVSGRTLAGWLQFRCVLRKMGRIDHSADCQLLSK